MPFGIATLVLVLAVALIVTLVVYSRSALARWRGKAELAGYASLAEYLRAPPRSEQEKKDAVDLAVKGGVICILGLVFPPAMLIGIVPLFYGTRKLAYSSFGLGLLDDSDRPAT